MASVDECRQALHEFAARLDVNAETGSRIDLDRTLAARITDLRTAFHGRLTGGRLIDITDGDEPTDVTLKKFCRTSEFDFRDSSGVPAYNEPAMRTLVVEDENPGGRRRPQGGAPPRQGAARS